MIKQRASFSIFSFPFPSFSTLLTSFILTTSTYIAMPDIAHACNLTSTRYETNKWEHKDAIQNGWFVTWGREITETDMLQGVVKAGISCLAENPAPLII
jgi:hypothetical protein